MLVNLDPVVRRLVLAIGAILLGVLLSSLINALLRRRQRRDPIMIGETALNLHLLRGPLQVLLPALAGRAVLPALEFEQALRALIGHALDLVIIGSIAWLARRGVLIARELVQERFPVDVEDNLEARRIQTQYRVIERVTTALIVILAAGAMLMTFEQVRQFGVSLLASAGIAGIVLGFAAQKSLGTLLAGIQIALSQPIRLDDVVIVEGEWGRIEEITLTYVVVKIWDQRRLVLPITYFIDNPFQNWTRTSAEILGTVYLYTDYTVPVQAVREELQRIVEGSDLWDGRVVGLVVTDAKEHTLELRALVSAADASKAWDLRCLVRENLISYLQENHPESLPRLRLVQESAGV
jgi:small-conductance mechanosensitive channel